jgi:hypothetical protein
MATVVVEFVRDLNYFLNFVVGRITFFFQKQLRLYECDYWVKVRQLQRVPMPRQENRFTTVIQQSHHLDCIQATFTPCKLT